MTGLGEGTFLSQGGQKEASSLANGSKGAESCKGGVPKVDPKSSEGPKGSSEGHCLLRRPEMSFLETTHQGALMICWE